MMVILILIIIRIVMMKPREAVDTELMNTAALGWGKGWVADW